MNSCLLMSVNIFRVPIACMLVYGLWPCYEAFSGLAEQADEHPLLPGVRSSQVFDPQWSSTLHDKLLTGFSPLRCGMKQAPRVWATIRTGGQADWAAFVRDREVKTFLLVQDASLRRIDSQGKVVWRRDGQRPIFCEDLHDDGVPTLGAISGRSLTLLDLGTGEPFWQREFEGTLGLDKVRVGRISSDFPGKQFVVFPQYANVGYLFAFPPGQRKPKLVWRTTDAGVRNWPERADHGATVILEPDGKAIWNIRHHTINVHDSKDGKPWQRFEFKSGGGLRRNYGPSVIGHSSDGKPLLAVAGQYVQHHLNCFIRSTDGSPSMILDRYIGEVYESHGVSSRFAVDGLGDVNGDGGLEVVYSARLVDPKPRTRVVVCDVGTGEEQVLEDLWLAGITDLDGDGLKEVFAYDDPKAEMPDRGKLHIYGFKHGGRLTRLDTVEHAKLLLRPHSPFDQPPEAAWCNARLRTPVVYEVSGHRGVMIRNVETGKTSLLKMRDGRVGQYADLEFLDEHEVIAVGKWNSPEAEQIVARSPGGQLRVFSSAGKIQFELPLTGGGPTLASASDFDNDKRCELVVRTPHDRLQVYKFDSGGNARLLWSKPFEASHGDSRLSIPARDIDGDGRVDVLGFGQTAAGRLSVCLYNAAGELVWQSGLPMSASGQISKWITGEFFGPGRPGIFVSASQDLAREESYMLDGRDGRIVWTGFPQDLPTGTRGCNPCGIPTVFDYDGDAKDDLLLDYRDHTAVHRGFDGKLLRPIRLTPPLSIGWRIAYNSFMPIHRMQAKKPEFAVTLGYGAIGLLANDLTKPVWMEEAGYDNPARAALVDVDGDSRTEIGYEEKRSGWFVCRDLLDGTEEWRIKLEGRGYGPALSADFDGDGKGEFLVGGYCIGTDKKGKAMIRWRTRVPAAGWGAIADIDGDGRGEIVMPASDGVVRVLKATD